MKAMLTDERTGKATFTRRDALKIAGAAGVMAALPWSGIPVAEAAAPALKGPQAGGYYRFMIGDVEAIVISDGGLSFQPIQPTWAPEASKEELEGMLQGAFLPTDRLNLDVNTLLLKIGGELILVDAGAGNLFGPSLGKVRERLSAAGVAPAQVTGVVVTHAHGDHFGGLLDADGKPVFPNALYFASKTEVDYWTGPDPDMSKLRLPEERKKVFAANAKRYLGAIKDRLTPVSPGQKILPGMEVLSAPGHTPGHIALLVSSGKETLLNAADTVHHHILMFAPPRLDLRLRLGSDDGGGDEAQDPRPGGGGPVAGPGIPSPVPGDRPRAGRQGRRIRVGAGALELDVLKGSFASGTKRVRGGEPRGGPSPLPFDHSPRCVTA
jgi:glyoxylase-like metal-dependent hydrolase (beta-lactamase superfamily II)